MTDKFQDTRPKPQDLDVFRLALTDEDFTQIDSDGDLRLDKFELYRRLEDTTNPITGEKREAVNGLFENLAKSGNEPLDTNSVVSLIIPKWNSFETAMNNISQQDFTTADKNLDGVLSVQEMKEGAENQSLSKATRLALGTLHASKHIDKRGLVGVAGISDWHALDPGFSEMSSFDLRFKLKNQSANMSEAEIKAAYEELLARDKLIQPGNPRQQVEEILRCQEALKKFKGVTRDETGRLSILDRPATMDDHELAARQMVGLIAQRDSLRSDQTDYAVSMYQMNNFPAAEKLLGDAIKESDTILETQPGSKSSMAEIILESKRLLENFNVRYRDPSLYGTHYRQLDRALLAPVDTRVENAKYFLAPVVRQGSLYFDSAAPQFNPDKAQKLLDDAAKQTRSVLGYVPRPTPNQASYYQSDRSIGDPKLKMDLLRDKDDNTKSDLIEHIKSFPWYGQRMRDQYIPAPKK